MHKGNEHLVFDFSDWFKTLTDRQRRSVGGLSAFCGCAGGQLEGDTTERNGGRVRGGVTGCELDRRENVRSALREMSQRKDGAVARGEVTVCKREGL